mgnify:FL=1|tara:strand:+ start:1840 stop:2598 length:759 start_codon:yes stop_codon:yes gene_type:complete
MEFFLSKFVGFFLSPLYLIIFLHFSFLIAHLFNNNFYKKIILYLMTFFILFFGNTGISGYILNSFEKAFLKPQINLSEITGLLILGGPLEEKSYHNFSEISLNGQVERLTSAIELYNSNKDLIILYSGFSNKINPTLSEAEEAKIFFKKMGIKEDKIILEKKSKNTLQNIVYSKNIIEKIGGNWLLITSAFHMKRAMFLSQEFKLKIRPYPVDWQIKKKSFSLLSYNFGLSFRYWEIILHELVGIVYYKIKI